MTDSFSISPAKTETDTVINQEVVIDLNTKDYRKANQYRQALWFIPCLAISQVDFETFSCYFTQEYVLARICQIPLVQQQLGDRRSFRFRCYDSDYFTTDDIEGLPVPIKIPIMPMRKGIDYLEGIIHLTENNGDRHAAWRVFSTAAFQEDQQGNYSLRVGNIGCFSNQQLIEKMFENYNKPRQAPSVASFWSLSKTLDN